MSETKGFSADAEVLKKNDEDFLPILKNWQEAAEDNKKFLEWEWYLYDNFYRGNHYLLYNRENGRITNPEPQHKQVRLTVNKIYSISRAIRNFSTSFRPKWEVIANDTSEEVINSSKRAADVLDYLYDDLKIPRLMRGATLHAIKFGIGIFQYGWDDEAEGFGGEKGSPYVWIRDPFDFYPDPSGVQTGDIQNCRYITVAVSKPLEDIKANQHYNLRNIDLNRISSDDDYAASEYKNVILTEKYSNKNTADSKELQTVILYETWYKKQVKIKAKKKGEKDTYETRVCLASWIDGHLLRKEVTEYTEYPFITFSSDDNPLEIYGEGYLKNLVPIVKVVNRLESQLVEYNNMVNRGRYVADKESDVDLVTDTTGEVIYKNAGAEFRELRPAGLAPDIHTQISRLLDYMDDISGVTDAFKGTTPSGVTAGIAIEALQAKSANNLEDLKTNLEVALEQLGRGILELIADKVMTPRTIRSDNKDYTSDEEYDAFKIKGEAGMRDGDEEDDQLSIIGKNNKIRVTMGAGIAYTMEGRWNRIKELHQMIGLPPQAILAAVEWPDLRNVVEEAKKAAVDQAMMANIEKNGLPGMQPPQGEMPPEGGELPPEAMPEGAEPSQEQQMIELALAEDEAMLQGQIIPPTENATPEHTQQHIIDSQSPAFKENEEATRLIEAHILGEEEAQGAPTPDSLKEEE